MSDPINPDALPETLAALRVWKIQQAGYVPHDDVSAALYHLTKRLFAAPAAAPRCDMRGCPAVGAGVTAYRHRDGTTYWACALHARTP